MTTRAFSRFAPLLALAIVLVACGKPEAQPSPEGLVQLSVTLDSSAAPAGDLSPLGLPFDPNDGNIMAQHVHVAVTDRDGNAINFQLDGGTYTASTNGSEAHIELSSSNNTAQVLLPAAGNPYA